MAGSNNDPPLFSAVRANNIVECRRLIDTGEANINEDRDQIGGTALHLASIRCYLEISELLTSSGADVNIRRSADGWTAVYVASFCGQLEIVKLLLCQGADMNIRDNNGISALKRASSYDDLKEVADCLRKWPWTMAIIALQEIDTYKYLDFSSIEDLWHYLGNQ